MQPWVSGDDCAEMYGPPCECKGKVSNEGKSASMYSAFRWESFLLALMRYAAYLSFENARPRMGHFGKQVSGAPF